uniref:non-specific serine/threonine protein kinase n=1 Tax=Fagus sylvatica TaxID=28930 RepID=A0A2N9HLL3_FAGSY
MFILLVFIQLSAIAAGQKENYDYVALASLKDIWQNTPPNWVGTDPCGNQWEGIGCNNSRVTSITLSSIGLTGSLSADLDLLSELKTLDLSYNKGLTGPLPRTIGSLNKLSNLILVGCSFSGPIPDNIGSLHQLAYLSLNSNHLSGHIPPSIGNLSNLLWLDLTDNQLDGPIPVSKGSTPGLDMLFNCRHLIFNGNQLTGSIPSTLGLVQSLQVLRLDGNALSGPVPSNFNNLTSLTQMYLSNNQLTGPVPNLTGMNLLSYVDISNNTFDASDAPSWVLKKNQLNGSLVISTTHSKQLKLIDLQYNVISQLDVKEEYNVTMILVGNPFCTEIGAPQIQIRFQAPTVVVHIHTQEPSTSKALSFSDLENKSKYIILEESLMLSFHSHQLPVDSVSLTLDNPIKASSEYLEVKLKVFPYGQLSFNRTGISSIGFMLSNQTFKPPPMYFGPFYFLGDEYEKYAESHKSSSISIIIEVAVGGSILLLVLLLAGVYAFHSKKRAERAIKRTKPFAQWDLSGRSGSAPEVKGVRCFSLKELEKYTNHFSEANVIGSGGYGKVYQGTLPTGQLIAIKQDKKGSTQGELEFKTEIELLSRVHHKNLVSLLGFCFEKGEQILVYEYVTNGSLKDSLSGKSGIRLDWMRRLRVALGAARGLAYLHEFADPPIIHRDIKSNNILLDESLNAKVADFGLSKPIADSESNVMTQVKGTMGYMDPEYYTTLRLTEKSDVYSFGVLMLELITSRKPIDQGKYIVKEVQEAMDKTKDLYNLHEFLDPAIGFGPTLKELEYIMELAGLNPDASAASTSESYVTSKGSFHYAYLKEAFDYSGALSPAPKIEPH